MRKPHWLWITLSLTAFAAVGCSDDNGGNGDTGGEDAGTTGDSDGGDDNGNGNNGNNNNGGDDGGTNDNNGDDAGSDSGTNGTCDLSGEGKDHETIPSPTGDLTLTSDKVWDLEGVTYVADGETLTIEPCTRIEGAEGTATLVVSRGGMIDAVGTADEPILFTSQFDSDRRSGDWGGVILLGKAPNYESNNSQIEGLPDAAENKYGGDEPDDNSGKMAYVRIEFGGTDLGDGNEVNGLTMGSVGSGTEIHHIMVNTTLDDCFEWFGGRVDAHHLICNAVGDDMFDADTGYQGKLEYLFGRLIPDVVDSGDPNGFEMDSDNDGDTPVTTVEVSHATLCGGNEGVGGASFGMVLRERLEGSIDDVVVTGFDFGVDTRNDFGSEDDPHVSLSNAQFFGMLEEDVRGEETDDADNDSGFSEDDWFEMGDSNEVPDPAPFSPADCLADDGPTEDVLDSGVGAFSDGLDDWNWDGQWIGWEIE